MFKDLTTMCVGPESSVQHAIEQMEVNRAGIILVVDAERRLLGTITDGDVRRAVLANFDLSLSAAELLASQINPGSDGPITASVNVDRSTQLHLLQQHKIRHLPLVDQDGRVVSLVTLAEFLPGQEAPVNAVIMAGGLGSRLKPLTDELPKPMLPLGDRPIMEIIVGQLRDAGIQNVNITLHHKPEKITDHFGDGREFGVDIRYVTEDQPLGTAGALGLMDLPNDTLLVINGDILTQLDIPAMLAFHREQEADLTMAVQRYNIQLPYGVVECQGASVRSLAEKPATDFLVNAGIYLLEPSYHTFIPAGEPFDMTDLIQRLIEKDLSVVAFPLREYWLDIGEHEDYERAQRDLKSGRVRI